jgi:hypothetical protein
MKTEHIYEMFWFLCNETGWLMKPKAVTAIIASGHNITTVWAVLSVFFINWKWQNLLNQKIITFIFLSSADG